MLLLPDTYYYIYNHANGDDNLFREERNYHYFLKKYSQYIDPVAETAAWCLMPNHFHLLVKIKNGEEIASTYPKFGTLDKSTDKSNFISKRFGNFFSSYTQSFNKVYDRRGSLFLKNFKRKEITDEDYLRNLVLYIHLNPVHHGFCKDIGEWKWTSYDSFIRSVEELVYQLFNDRENYQMMHRSQRPSFDDYDK